jgi:3-hydroxy-3-methylglutaryl CoA synthase
MRGIISAAAYLPYRRLDRGTIAAVAGLGGGSGTRTVASYDEDSTTLGVEAARLAMAPVPARPHALWFSTVAPAYVDKTNACAIHAALQLPHDVMAADLGGAVRSGVAALRLALDSRTVTLVVAADIRTGLPGSADESAGGDGAAALLIGDDTDGPVLAEHVGSGAATAEFTDRWRTPGDDRSKQWEEKLGENAYGPLVGKAFADAVADAGLTTDDVDTIVVSGLHQRACRSASRSLGPNVVADDLSKTVGNPGAAQPGLLLTAALEAARPGQVIALVVLADGADVLLFRTTDAVAAHRPARPVAAQVAQGAPVTYGRFLTWRGMLTPEPPRRPEPARVSSSAAARNVDWKYGLVGSRDRESGAVQVPPARVSTTGGTVDDMEPVPLADALGTIATFTVDRMAWSPSPPVIFALVDLDGGGRFPVELTDVDVEEVAVGGRVEMTFRRLSTADGIHNYFWKARPVRTQEV